MVEAAAAPNADKSSSIVGSWLRPCLALILLAATVKEGQTILTTAYTICLYAIETYGYSE